jgi:hypothetical protein
MTKKRVRLSKQEKERLTIRDVLDQIAIEDLTGTPSDVSRYLLEGADVHDDYDELFYEWHIECYEGGDSHEFLRLVGYKQETDEEYEKRIENIKKIRRKEIEKQEKAEKIVLKKLLKKYGNN